jgi:plastocyanin
MRSISPWLTISAAAAFAASLLLASASVRAEDARVITITIKDHKFDPSELHVPAGKPIVLVVQNADATAEEFDSSALKVEKIIAGGQKGTLRLRPLAAGSYPFQGEFHSDTANGKVIAE